MNDQNNTRALAQQNGAQITKPQSTPPALDFSQIDPAIMARAAAIAAEVMANGGQINPAQALAAAYHFEQTGEVIGRHAYVGTTGGVAGKVLEGYRSVARELDMSKYQWRYRPLTDAEKEMRGVQPGDRALICELDVLPARKQCIEMGVPYDPIVGCTVIKKGQLLNVPKNRDAYWVLCKQARTDALRQVGEHTEADEVLAEAGIEAPEGYLSVEQAERYVASKQETQAALERHNAMTPEEKQADIDALKALNALRKLDEQHAFDGGPCPLCGAPEKAGHTAECGLRVLYPNAKTWVAPSDAGASAEESAFARTLREFRELLAAQPDQEAPADKRTVGQAKWALTVLLSESTQRHALTLALLGEDDATKWTQAEALAVLRWIDPQKQILDDGQEVWLPSARAIDGAKIVLAEVTQQQPA